MSELSVCFILISLNSKHPGAFYRNFICLVYCSGWIFEVVSAQ